MQIKPGQQTVQTVDHFTYMYLGCLVCKSGDVEVNVTNRIGRAATVFQRMNYIWKASIISSKLKTRLYATIVLPTALYGNETWKSTKKVERKLDVFHQRCLRKILKISYRDHIISEEMLRRTETRPLHKVVTVRRLKLAGHILRLPNTRHAKIAMTWISPDGKHKGGQPKITWRRTLQKDLLRGGIAWEDVKTAAEDRAGWRMFAARCPTLDGKN